MKTRINVVWGLLVIPLVIVSCQSGPQKELSSGLYLDHMDTTVRPGDNFTRYVNGTWMKNTKIPADKSSWGAGYILYEKSRDNVKAIIEEAAKNPGKDGSDEQKIGDFYASYMDMDKRNSLGMKPLQNEFQKIEAISNQKELAIYFAYADRIGMAVPFGMMVMADFKDPGKYMLLADQSGLGLPDREYYFMTDAATTNIRTKYLAHIEKMLTIAGVADAKAKSEAILKLETSMAGKQAKKEDRRNMNLMYNPVASSQLKNLMPNFDWEAYFNEAAIKYDTMVVTSPAYQKALDGILKSTPLDTWKAYLKWQATHRAATSLTADMDKQHFEFYSKTLYGVQEQEELWRRGVSVVSDRLGEMIGKLYVAKHFPPEAKQRMDQLVKNLLGAYETSIQELDWMKEETKKQALDKLKKFTPKIGYPDKWKDYSALKVTKEDLYGNRKRSAEFAYQRMMEKLGKKVDRTEWEMTPQTVNAYYNPSLNEIVFPAAILQPPFFDMEADDAVNYGAIGAVIGHEIGHGFDDQGSTFDGNGSLRNWWTDEDRKEFEKRTGSLVAQYNSFKVLPDLHVNGTFTLGENIGDLGGLSIALKAYKASLNGKEGKVMDGFTGEQRVFFGWAQVWLEKATAESIRAQIGTDPHSPANIRVNGVVRNIPEFYTAFDIQPTDSLYLAPKDRVKIW